MKKNFFHILPAFVFVLCSTKVFSQPFFFMDNFPGNAHDSLKFSAGFYSEAFLNSTSVTNHFFHQFRKNGYVNNEIKDEISKNMKQENRVGADINSGLFFSHRFAERDSLHSHWTYFIHLADKAHLDAGFPKDFFDLALYGNKKFAGDTAVLDKTSVNYFRFQQFQTGMIRKTQSGNRYGFGLSYLKGEENFYLNMKHGRLFTQEYGENLDASISAEISMSDTANKGMDAFNGWGASAAVFAEFPVFSGDNPGLFRIEASDLGFIQWNNKSLHYKGDTALHYEGVQVDNIFQLNDSLIKTLSPDTGNLRSFQKSKIHRTVLPAYFKLMYEMNAGNYLFSFGIVNRIYASYFPFFYFKTGYRINHRIAVSSKLSYGGYGNIGVGAEAVFSFTGLFLVAGTNNLEGIALPKYSGGNSGFIAVRKNF